MENSDEIKVKVRDYYKSIVEAPKANSSCCSGSKEAVENLSFAEKYSHLDGYFPEADYQLGCGVPTEFAKLKPGDTVVDLGSGAGNDCFVCRSIVGETGFVIGVDMTPEMIFKARKNKEKLNYQNVEFRLGEIENLPVESETVDVVISNCVMNIVPDKEKAYSETYRILKPGGHLSISDIVIAGHLPEELRNNMAAYAACISGAIDIHDYINTIKAAGFKNINIQKEVEMPIPKDYKEKYFPETLLRGLDLPKVLSITVYAEKY